MYLNGLPTYAPIHDVDALLGRQEYARASDKDIGHIILTISSMHHRDTRASIWVLIYKTQIKPNVSETGSPCKRRCLSRRIN